MAKAQPTKGNSIRTALRCGAALSVIVLALAGCRESEQDRVLWYEPGVFKGDREATPLDQGDLAELRERAIWQAGSGTGGRGVNGVFGGSRATGSNVRPPEPNKE